MTVLRANQSEVPRSEALTIGQGAFPAASRGGGGLSLCYAATLLVSSTLLFLVQPIVGKMILPVLGGTPAVWNTCMLFFQAMLLAGYAYSHFAISLLGVRRQAVVHILLLAVPFLFLPITVGNDAPPDQAEPGLWLLGRLLATVGLPFFVVSTSAPLLQRWFAASGHPLSADPYFLYAASNAGSLVALASYPLWVERVLGLAEQSRLWMAGYALLTVMVGVCAITLLRARLFTDSSAIQAHSTATGPSPTLGQNARWIILAFVPSSLLLGVTGHITTNLAAMPLLWVIPLGLYLLTFVLVFARRPWISSQRASYWLPFGLLPLAVLIFVDLGPVGWLAVPVHLGVFFLVALVCHGELARIRPAAVHLTRFYLYMSIGGVLGGAFNALVAPAIFDSLIEYPLALAAAALLRPEGAGFAGSSRQRRLDWALPLTLAGAAAVLIAVARLLPEHLAPVLVFAVTAGICSTFKDRPRRFGLGFAVLLVTVGAYQVLEGGRVLYAERNFFGVKRVEVDRPGRYRLLVHGSTNHGLQSVDPARRTEPLGYYGRSGPLGDVFESLQRQLPGAAVAVIGLGTGATACYAEPGQRFTFYEIDPAVERIAREPRYFTYLTDCRGAWDVVIGDGRLTLASAADRHFGLIILDAFTSDAIPAHLLTREALRLYLSKLRDGGLLAFHVSNRYLDLMPLLGNLSAAEELVALARTDRVPPEERESGRLPSQYVVMARREEDLRGFTDDSWQRVIRNPDIPVWTDQRSDLLSLIRWR